MSTQRQLLNNRAPVETRSNNVKRYVRAVWRRDWLRAAAQEATVQAQLAERRLTGGQLAEARRLLTETPRLAGTTAEVLQ